jgi:hypothetical protein
MRPRKQIVLMVLLAVCLPRAYGGKKDDRAEAAAMFKKAYELSSLCSAQSWPFQLHAHVRFFEKKAVVSEGTVTISWADRKLQRRDYSLSGFTEEDIQSGDKQWVKRRATFIPLRVWQMNQLFSMNFGCHPPGPLPGKPHLQQSKVNGSRVSCVELELGYSQRSETCFDPQDGVFLSNTRIWRGGKSSYVGSREVYSEYAPFGNISVPHKMEYLDRGQPAVEVQLEDIKKVPSFDSELFARPEGSEERPVCDGPITPPQPRIPSPPYKIGVPQSGRLTIYFYVDAEGRATSPMILESMGGNVDGYILDLVQKSRNQPATCNGVPIGTDFFFQIDFDVLRLW